MKHILNIFRKATWKEYINKWVPLTDNNQEVDHVMMNQIELYINEIKTPQLYLEDNPQQTPHDIEVRVAELKDTQGIFKLEMLGYDGYEAWSRKDFYNDLMSNPHAVYLLLEDMTVADSPELVGMITGRARAKNSHISHLIIHPEYQGYGLGKFLLQLWINEMERQKIQEITLEVRESNQVAQNLYSNNGFVVTSSKANYYRSNNETALNMRRKSQNIY